MNETDLIAPVPESEAFGRSRVDRGAHNKNRITDSEIFASAPG
ncbi:hypothetical protein [Caballeronia calidae]|nr:hypothetical protein [Caballeronia calidae]